eukprot:s5288_g3.t1
MDSLDASGVSDLDSPTSPLQETGEGTEANLELLTGAFDVEQTTDDWQSTEQQGLTPPKFLQNLSTILDHPPELEEVPKRRKTVETGSTPSTTSGVNPRHGAQLMFSASVEAIADECNQRFDVGGRVQTQLTDAILRLQRRESLKMPWDSLPHKQFWNMAKPAEFFKLPILGRFDKPAFHPIEQMVEDERSQWAAERPFASKRLLAAKFAQSDDALLAGALRKLRNILLYHPADSQLGRALLTKAGSLVAEDDLQRSLRDSISSKAVGTVVKRVTDYNKFAQFLVSDCHKRPLCPDEPDFFRYLCHLKQEGAGATAGASLLQAWSFFKFMFGVDAGQQAPLASGRVRGVVNVMFAAKRKLVQAPPLPADYVYRMERFMQTSRDNRLRTIVGFLLFCIYSCARFGDASKGDPKDLSFQAAASSDMTLVEISLSSYKTATGERKAILLPLIALGCGLDESSWAMAWKEARKASGADAMGHLMSADSHCAEVWLNRRMTTAEGSYWTKDVLVMLGMDPQSANSYSSHSLKATCLSWVSKAGNMSLQERLWLGHHESEEGKMATTYARDALVASLIKLRMVVEAIKKGLFDPDLPRAERISQATGAVIDPKTIAERSHVEEETDEWFNSEEMNRAAQLAESDVEDAEAVVDRPIALPSEKLGHDGRHPFPALDPSCCVQHRLSGIVHMIADVEKLSCGRKISSNMVPLENSFGGAGQLEFCEQCRAVSGL